MLISSASTLFAAKLGYCDCLPSLNYTLPNIAASMQLVAIGARVMLRRNVCIEDGLVNGGMGSVVGHS